MVNNFKYMNVMILNRQGYSIIKNWRFIKRIKKITKGIHWYENSFSYIIEHFNAIKRYD